jgi:hypothetical protein
MNGMDRRICILQTIPRYQESAQDHFDKFVAIIH